MDQTHSQVCSDNSFHMMNAAQSYQQAPSVQPTVIQFQQHHPISPTQFAATQSPAGNYKKLLVIFFSFELLLLHYFVKW